MKQNQQILIYFVLKLLKTLETLLDNPLQFVVSDYFYDETLSDRIVKSINYLIKNDSQDLSFDGLIFQKENTRYKTKSIFKWKPASLLSIDLTYKDKLFYGYGNNKQLIEFNKIRDWEIKDKGEVLIKDMHK